MTFVTRCGQRFPELKELLAHVMKASYYGDIKYWDVRIYLDKEA